ncbi:uncharacterized protein GBIM_15665 [Gryllus bimaculatus]|nr:uncharacterized protein GBIM_15665 [Gryllus bimaculatus]
MADVQLRVLTNSLRMEPVVAAAAAAEAEVVAAAVAEAEAELAPDVLPVGGERARRLAELSAKLYPGGLVRVGSVGGGKGCVLPAAYVPHVEAVRGMAVRPDDVWVVAPPKCGTTWMQELVWLLVNNLDFDAAKQQPLVDRFPNLEEAKDVAVSYFHHDRLLNGYSGDQDFHFECFMEDLLIYTPFWDHVLEFWEMRKQKPNILFVLFEDMKKDLPATIRKVATFLGREVSAAQVAGLSDHLDFQSMRDNPAVNRVPQLEAERGPLAPEQRFLRRGEVGDGRRVMAPTTAARLDTWSRQHLAGSDFPWRP